MKVTSWGATSDTEIWPEENNLRIVFDELIALKKERNNALEQPGSGAAYNVEYARPTNHQPGSSDVSNVSHPKRMMKVKGNPNLTDRSEERRVGKECISGC